MPSEPEDGGPAFPTDQWMSCDHCGTESKAVTAHSGMSLRAYFAAKAMEGLVSREHLDMRGKETLARECCLMADALLKELARA